MLSAITGKVLDPDWEQHLDEFRQSAIEYFRACSHIGECVKSTKNCSNIYSGHSYVHLLEHYRDFMKKTGQSPGLVANDQVYR